MQFASWMVALLAAKVALASSDFDHGQLLCNHITIMQPLYTKLPPPSKGASRTGSNSFTGPKRAQGDFLVSLDRRHLVGQPDIAQRSGLRIVLPEELLEALRC
jgi:hypothetical protein